MLTTNVSLSYPLIPLEKVPCTDLSAFIHNKVSVFYLFTMKVNKQQTESDLLGILLVMNNLKIALITGQDMWNFGTIQLIWSVWFCASLMSFCPPQAGVCGCEEGYTEVMTSDGVLDQCTLIPVLEIPTAGDSKTDVKTIRAMSPTQASSNMPGRSGRTWYLQPFGPGGLEPCSKA